MKKILGFAGVLSLWLAAGCATPQRQIRGAVADGRADEAAQVAKKTPTLDGERTLDVALRLAAQSGRPQMIAELIARGADANSGRELTPLMFAAWNGHATTIEALLARGADPNLATAKYKRTALMYAARFGNEDSVRALLAGGADARPKDWRGVDAAGYARKGTHFDVVPLLAGAAETSPAPAAKDGR